VKGWRTTTKVYAGLAVLTLVTVVLTLVFWDQAWVRDWMPNFIAEWSGLFLAVAIVDRLLSRARTAEIEKRRAPERQLAGNRLALALEPIVNTVVHEYARRRRAEGMEDEEPPEAASAFFERWSATVEGSPEARDPAWVYVFANVCERSSEALNKLRVEYDVAFEPGERANIANLADALSRDERDMGYWAEDIDPAFERTGVRRHLPRFTADDVAHNVGNRCTQLSPLLALAANDYRSLTGAVLTTQAGWESVRVMRAGVEIVAKGIIAERNPNAHGEDEQPVR
jgi:hypothetical protein